VVLNILILLEPVTAHRPEFCRIGLYSITQNLTFCGLNNPSTTFATATHCNFHPTLLPSCSHLQPLSHAQYNAAPVARGWLVLFRKIAKRCPSITRAVNAGFEPGLLPATSVHAYTMTPREWLHSSCPHLTGLECGVQKYPMLPVRHFWVEFIPRMW